jgi:hypothetical protein
LAKFVKGCPLEFVVGSTYETVREGFEACIVALAEVKQFLAGGFGDEPG